MSTNEFNKQFEEFEVHFNIFILYTFMKLILITEKYYNVFGQKTMLVTFKVILQRNTNLFDKLQ